MTYKISKEERNDLNRLGKLKIKDGTLVIPEDAFRGCVKLKSLIVPASVKKIEKGAFARCINLRKIVFEGQVPIYNVDAFEGCDEIEEVEYTVPQSALASNEVQQYSKILKTVLGVRGRVIAHYPNDDAKEMQ